MTSRVRIAPETTLLARKSTALGRKTERARGAWCGCTASAGASERPGAGLAGGLPAGGGCTAPGNGSALSRQAVSDACARLRLGKSQLYELLRRYRIDPRTTSLDPGSGGIPKVAAWWCHRTVVRRWRRGPGRRLSLRRDFGGRLATDQAVARAAGPPDRSVSRCGAGEDLGDCAPCSGLYTHRPASSPRQAGAGSASGRGAAGYVDTSRPRARAWSSSALSEDGAH